MRLLLDTHAFLWWLLDDGRLTRRARAQIADESNPVYVSAASAWEVTTKVRLGKLPGAEFLAQDFARYVVNEGFVGFDITVKHGQRAGALPGPHRDPFDRMLIAQAMADDLAIVSGERVFDSYGVCRVW